jgi:hypothetical protein
MDEPVQNLSLTMNSNETTPSRGNNSKSPLKSCGSVINNGQQMSINAAAAAAATTNNPLSNLMFAANPYLSPLLQFPQLLANAPFELIQQLTMANEELLKSSLADHVKDETTSIADGLKPENANTVACDLCQKEFFNEHYLNLHRINKHMHNGSSKRRRSMSSTSSIISANSSEGTPTKRKRKSNDLSQLDNSKLSPSLSITNPAIFGIMDSYFAAKMADRVTCDICNKQVCNKYFLKTHKLKVHGCTDSTTGCDLDDSMDDQQQQHQQQQQPNEDVRMSPSSSQSAYQQHTNQNGAGSGKTRSRPPALARVLCQICNKELCNKYFLRSHLLNAHNINLDESSNTAIAYDEAADTKLKVKTHEQNDNTNDTTITTNKSQVVDNDDEDEDGEDDDSASKTNSNIQAFYIDSSDDLFKANFLPCMVYLPVTKKLDKPVRLTLKLIPLPDIPPSTQPAN